MARPKRKRKLSQSQTGQVSKEVSDFDRARQYISKCDGVGEGGRNNACNRLAYGVLERFILTENEHRELMLEWNQRNSPPLAREEALAAIRSAWLAADRNRVKGTKRTELPSKTPAPPPPGDSDIPSLSPKDKNLDGDTPDKPKKKRGPSLRDRMLSLIDKRTLFHSAEGIVYSRLMINGHIEIHAVREDRYRRWLSMQFVTMTGKPPSNQALNDAINVAEGWGDFQGPEHEVFIRVGHADGKHYLDLCDRDWNCIEVDADGWRIRKIGDTNCHFVRADGMKELPRPVKDGNLTLLWDFLNVDEGGFILAASWLLGAVNPFGPYPILILQGEQGSAKTTSARVLRAIIDTSAMELQGIPKEERDLLVRAENSWVLGFDNLSRISEFWSDVFCRLSTGAGFAVRKHYSNKGQVTFYLSRPVLLTGISNLGQRPDLQNRAVTVTCKPIARHQRREENRVLEDFRQKHPQILGGLLDAWSASMRGRAKNKFEDLPRMADFAAIILGAEFEDAVPWDRGQFCELFLQSQEQAMIAMLETSPSMTALSDFITELQIEYEGTASELLEILTNRVPENVTKRRSWPLSASKLGEEMDRYAPVLRAVSGIEFSRRRTGNARKLKIWIAEKVEK
ncbi:MAG: hypothetical protein DRP56_09655 [Planctomycetota bacterium]|nr:MAG: hypothetical protein DRP56_09655 [Planctomycetota bacterium]